MAEPPTPRITTVVSDFGGVLTTPLLAAFAAFQDDSGISPEKLGLAMREGLSEGEEIPLFKLERGEISEDAFIGGLEEGLESVLGHRPHLHHFRQKFWGALQPNEEM